VRCPRGDPAEAALEGGGLAGIVDDEGIDDRQGPDRTGGPAVERERDRLAGEPLGGAVGAELDQRVEALPQAEMEGEVGVRRGEIGVVVAVLALE